MIVAAGDFLEWLAGMEAGAEQPVPCGTCRGCCRGSMFIDVGPEDRAARAVIPRRLLFAAPGRPKGHQLIGYDEHGRCPMLVDGDCSIYAQRPQTCRDFDCRLFAATGLSVEQAEIARRVEEWEFSHASEASRRAFAELREAATFFQQHAREFPRPLAMVVIRLWRRQREMAAAGMGEAAMVDALRRLVPGP